MAKIWNSPAKLVNVVELAISAYNGVQADTGQVTDILKSLLELAVSRPYFLSLAHQ
jgi:hypothetical protein